MKIFCVIVTYNRLTLLKECIAAVKKQSLMPDRILVIDNHSTDGTSEYLQGVASDSLIHVPLPQNVGGAGGFSTGIKEAVLQGADYVWVMDDDTIPHPHALQRLATAISVSDNIGFLCSKVIWTDGTPHAMNVPRYCNSGIEFNRYSTEDIPAFPVCYASFVSLLINADAVKKVGLPIAEFFIWADDSEYTTRIVEHGFQCFYVDNSIVTHKTTENYAPYPNTAPKETAWKFYYQARNTTFLKRKSKRLNKISLFFSTLNMYRLYVRKINQRQDGNKALFKKNVWRGCMDGLSFNPPITFVQEQVR